MMRTPVLPANLSLRPIYIPLYIGVPILVGASCYYYYMYIWRSNKGPLKDATRIVKKQLSPLEQLMHLKQTGNQNFSRKNYDVAIEHYTSAIELSQSIIPPVKPDDLAIFHQNRAACNEALGLYDQVVEDCCRAIELKKTYIKAYLRRAKAFEKLQDYDKALVDAYSANLLEKFQNQTSLILTENIVKTSSKTKATDAMKTHKLDWPSNQTIRTYFSAFTQDPIKEKLEDVEIKSPEHLKPLLEEANKPENDNDPLSLLIRGSCLSLMGDMQAARNAFDTLLAQSDTDCPPRIKSNAMLKKAAIVLSDLSSTMSIEKDLENVMEILDQAIKLDPENPDAYLHKSQAMTLTEKFEEAIKCLDEALAINKDFHSAYAQKFYLKFKLATKDSINSHKLQKLMESFKSSVDEHPNARDLHQMYAQVLTECSYFEEADQVLINLIKSDPTDASAYVSRALLQLQLKPETEEVTILLQEALKNDPKIIFAYEILGSIASQRGEIDEAIKIFESALKYAQSEAEYARCFSQLDSARCQKKAAEALGMQV